MSEKENLVVDPKTGGAKGQKDIMMGALDPMSIMEVARVAGLGAKKYARYNFLKGYNWSLSYDALMRHLSAFWAGQDKDPEFGVTYHLAHAAWHCLTLLAFARRGIGTDDRPPADPQFVAALQDRPVDPLAPSGAESAPLSMREQALAAASVASGRSVKELSGVHPMNRTSAEAVTHRNELWDRAGKDSRPLAEQDSGMANGGVPGYGDVDAFGGSDFPNE